MEVLRPTIRRTTTGTPDEWAEWPDGRTIWTTVHDEEPPEGYQTALLRRCLGEEYPKGFQAQDVLAIRLFRGSLEPGTLGNLPDAPLPEYQDLLALLRDVGPRVAGVIVGNQGIELSYRHKFGQWDGDWSANLSAMASFILRVGETLRDLGARPIFAAMDWDILQDAYRGNGMLLRALTEVGAANYVGCGYALIPGCHVRQHERQTGEQLRWQMAQIGQGHVDPEPAQRFTVLEDYLHRGEFWSGLSGVPGMLAGNIPRLHRAGFCAFTSHFADSDLPALRPYFEETFCERATDPDAILRDSS